MVRYIDRKRKNWKKITEWYKKLTCFHLAVQEQLIRRGFRWKA
jgi:hypothetical protein